MTIASSALWNRIVRPHGEESYSKFRIAVHEDVKPVQLARHPSVYWARKKFNVKPVVYKE